MDKIIWQDSYSVGVRRLDDQHKKIIHVCNKLIELNDVRVDSEIISSTLNELIKYTLEHFELEEKMMAENNYPEYSSNKAQHKLFMKKTTAFCLDTMAHKATIPDDILTFLINWWVNHILISDMKYKSFFSENLIS